MSPSPRRFTRFCPITRLEDRIAPAVTPVGPLERPYTFTEVLASVRVSPTAALSRTDLFDTSHIRVILETGGTQLVEYGLRAGADPLAAVAQLQETPGVEWASPNHIVYGDTREFTPNDPSYSSQFFHTKMQTDKAWDVTTGNPSIVVAITDDGLAYNHPDLAANVWTNSEEVAGNGIDDDGNGRIDDIRGWDFSSGDADPNPVSTDTHGTHVAGILAARSNNGTGVAGTAGGGPNGDGIRMMAVRFYGSGAWTASVIASSFTYAANNGAKIVSTSYNFDGWASGGVQDPVIKAALDYSYGKGVLHFISAGNNNELDAARRVFDQVLFVASSDSADVKSSFSNYGKFVDITAPGSSIYSTLTGSAGTTFTYGNQSGTSMATPAAAAVAALIWSKNPTWTRDQVAAQLLGTADNINTANPAYAGLLGTGRANAYQGVTATLPAPKLGATTGLPAEGSTVSQMPATFAIDVPARFDPATMTSTAFEMVGDGLDNTFGTADDNVLSLTINGGSPYLVGVGALNFTVSGSAPADSYRFRAKSGGLRSPFNVALDGNGDGTGGDDFVRNFVIGRAVEGTVFVDRNQDGLKNSGEATAGAGWVVFDDANNNGLFDVGGGTFNSTAVPVAIPDNTKVTSTVTVTGVIGTLTDVDVRLNITHTYDADVDIFLIAPDGTRIELSTDNGGSGQNYVNTVFDDSAATSVTTGTAPFTGTYKPEGLLATLNGKSGNGVWTLEVTDDAGTDTGTLNSWSVTLKTFGEQSATTAADGSFVFSALPPDGAHVLRLQSQPGFNVTSGSASITVTPGTTAVANFGVLRRDSVYGRLFNDANANGIDNAEPGLTGWVVYSDADNNGILDGSLVNPSSTNVPVTIPDNTKVTSTITTAGLVGNITDINVSLDITHTYDADVDIFLIAPDGTRVELSTDNGGSSPNYKGTTFDDQAAVSIVGGLAPFTGAFIPEGSLATLNGKSPNGVWTLEVADDATTDTGTIDGWSLSITSGEASAVTDASGYYEFANVAAGAVNLRRVLQGAFVGTSPVSGVHAFTHVAGASDAKKDFGQTNVAIPPAKVVGVVVNGGSTQRSMVTSVLVTFDQIVSFAGPASSAFGLSRQSGGSVALSATVDNSGGATAVTLSFAGGEVDPGLPSLSLRDGRYTLTIDAAQVSTPAGLLDGDGNGSPGGAFSLAGSPGSGPGLYRLFGDVDGSGQVDAGDFLSFRLAFLQPAPQLDSDASGQVDSADFLAFRLRFLQSV
ncbi:MAG: S8 family serine peptidase [Gemmataceae bacterium]|nr:S8 family serine peptidase [Gemmataceae bacterium]